MEFMPPLGLFFCSLLLLPMVLSVGYFFYYLIKKQTVQRFSWLYVVEMWILLLQPSIFLFFMDIGRINDCCGDSAIFSADNDVAIYTLIIAYTIAYFIVVWYPTTLLAPLVEVFISIFLLLGIAINIVLCMHLYENYPWIVGNIPIILLLLIQIVQRQRLLISFIKNQEWQQNNSIQKLAYTLLTIPWLLKYPLLLVLLFPLIAVLSGFLMLFGQEPDAIIRAFTDTYKHGFSQLDYMCDNVQCGGHFLCSVGANGHPKIVKPIRYGERKGNRIICTRQLLISNAFEEVIQEKFPKLHTTIRRQYNKVGNKIHRYYTFFEIKIVSDSIYICMKPLEWLFLLVLYTTDKYPENRIARQYIGTKFFINKK